MNGGTGTKQTNVDEVKSKINTEERDKEDKWIEVMKRAEQYGFIQFVYSGFAMLSIDEEAMKTK